MKCTWEHFWEIFFPRRFWENYHLTLEDACWPDRFQDLVTYPARLSFKLQKFKRMKHKLWAKSEDLSACPHSPSLTSYGEPSPCPTLQILTCDAGVAQAPSHALLCAFEIAARPCWCPTPCMSSLLGGCRQEEGCMHRARLAQASASGNADRVGDAGHPPLPSSWAPACCLGTWAPWGSCNFIRSCSGLALRAVWVASCCNPFSLLHFANFCKGGSWLAGSASSRRKNREKKNPFLKKSLLFYHSDVYCIV